MSDEDLKQDEKIIQDESEDRAQDEGSGDDEALKAEADAEAQAEAEAAEAEAEAEEDAEQTPEERIAELEAALASAEDRALRAHAEAENTRARTRRDLEKSRKFAVEPLAKDLMTALDHLGRARQAITPEQLEGDETLKNLLVGVEMTEKELLKAFDKHKIERVDPMGDPFDPEHHQALQNVPGTGADAGTVIETVAPGYVMHGRLLRAAMVLVAA